MVVDLEAASGTKYLVLCDPTSVQGVDGIARDEIDPRLVQFAADGRVLLIYIPEGDCEATVRVFVNEEPAPALMAAACKSPLEAFRLHLPSGVIQATGAEDVNKEAGAREPGTFAVGHVGAGTFAGKAFDTIRWKLRNRKRYVTERTTPAARRLRAVQNVAGFAGAVLIVGHILAVGPLVGIAFRFGRRAGLIALASLLAFDLLAWLFVYFLDRASKTMPIFNQVRLLEEEFNQIYPDVVVALTPGPAPCQAAPAILVME